MSRWPADNQAALLKFYGTPGPEVERQLVNVVPPFQMYYDGKPVRQIKFHKKAATALSAALNEIWEHYGRDQKKIDALGISKYAGAYNPRFIRGSTTKWSNHAYGAAIDLNAEDNGFGKGHGNIPQPVIDAFKRQGARWGGDYRGRTDPMHFEFCDAGPQFVKPVGLLDDAPMVDGDSDAPEPTPPQETAVVSVDKTNQARTDEIQASVEADTETRGSWLKRKWRGVTSTVGGFLGLGGAAAFDWRIVAILLGAAFLFTVAIVLFMGPGDVRAWVRKQVS
jgi:hypothetical protein